MVLNFYRVGPLFSATIIDVLLFSLPFSSSVLLLILSSSLIIVHRYINRMRGYHGMSMMDSWYSFLERKTKLHTWDTVNTAAYAYEWPDGWIGIDADTRPQKTEF